MRGCDHGNEPELYYTAAAALEAAYRELGDAADCLRGLASSAALRAIGEAKEAITRVAPDLELEP